MKIKIIPERCIACGLCHTKAPQTFDYHDNGIVKFYTTPALEEDFPETMENITAVKSCPTSALQIVKEKN
ncbi:ferredoxin [Lactococcus fujiensis]|uniref:Ferredoxin n=1 Tax=Lactococcus fujiensis JCM 16395 TaxID=1291764 RepID=A0A2A5RPH6_9LACT|nr:ferredoxin [Lactococcus fujiensis]PCS01345.1 ferredoxin [Lactococcus fujiensis JCM 16395]